MEVHHSHFQHRKKKFKEYFLEFLTLFIAVTMGFFAENLRDNRVERVREKEYIESMIKELKADSQQLTTVFQDTPRIKKLDTLFILLMSNDFSPEKVRKIYQLRYQYSTNFEAMIFNRNTLTQLKNSGNMRLIRKQNVVDSLNLLDNMISEIEDQKAAWTNLIMDNIKESYFILDESYFVRDGKILPFKEVLQNPEIKLITNDKIILRRFGSKIWMQSLICEEYFFMLKKVYAYQNRLIPFLEKEYHLE